MNDKLSPDSNANLLGFSELWFKLGLLTLDQLDELEAQYHQSDDKHAEHYRWRVFKKFLSLKRPLTPDLALSLYRLGDADPDFAMGGSIMADIVNLPECPAQIVALALSSHRKHLRTLAQRKQGSS